MSAKATKSTLGHAKAHRTTSVPRAPMPIIPMRTRSLAPSTPLGEANVVARPVAIVPINLRRESIIVTFCGSISILEHWGGLLVLNSGADDHPRAVSSSGALHLVILLVPGRP